MKTVPSSPPEKNEFSIDKTARMLKESRGTVAHRLKGICFEYLAASKGDTDSASLELSGGVLNPFERSGRG